MAPFSRLSSHSALREQSVQPCHGGILPPLPSPLSISPFILVTHTFTLFSPSKAQQKILPKLHQECICTVRDGTLVKIFVNNFLRVPLGIKLVGTPMVDNQSNHKPTGPTFCLGCLTDTQMVDTKPQPLLGQYGSGDDNF